MKKFLGASIIAVSLLTAGLSFAATTTTPTPAVTAPAPTTATPQPNMPAGTRQMMGRSGFMFRGGAPFTNTARPAARLGMMSILHPIADVITLLLLWAIMILLIMLLARRLRHDHEHHHHHNHDEHPEPKK